MTRNIFLSESDLNGLAHEGTKEAISKIEAYMKIEKDENKKAYAEIALEECELFYYQPMNKKEDEEFLLSYLICQRENTINRSEVEVDRIKAVLDKFTLEKKVHLRVLEKNKSKGDAWKYNCMDDFVIRENKKLAELKDNIQYDEAWMAEAKKMITTTRYKSGIPYRHLSHYDFGFDELRSDEDDCGNDCCDRC